MAEDRRLDEGSERLLEIICDTIAMDNIDGLNWPGVARLIRCALTELRLVRGAMAAQDEREAQAGGRCDMPRERYGCDWPDWMAEALLSARAAQQHLEIRFERERAELRGASDEITFQVKRAETAERQLTTLRDRLRKIEFLPSIGMKCPACVGWNVDLGRGETALSHTTDCWLAAALRAAPQGEHQ